MATVKITDLKKAAKELNALLFEPGDEQIEVKSPVDELTVQVIQASYLLKENEISELTETSQDVINTLLNDPDYEQQRQQAEEETEEEEGSLHSLVKQCISLEQLKNLITEEDMFKPLRKTIGLQKDVEKLRAKMVNLIQVAPQVGKTAGGESSPKKAPGKQTPKPAAKKESKPKSTFNRVDSVCIALQSSPKNWAEWIKKADEVMRGNGGQPNPNEAKFIARYVVKVAAHFDLGVNVPKIEK